MELNKTNTQPYHVLTKQQRRIYQRLLLVGEGPAAFYRDACRIMVAEPSFETITHLMGHCLREIERVLPGAHTSVAPVLRLRSHLPRYRPSYLLRPQSRLEPDL